MGFWPIVPQSEENIKFMNSIDPARNWPQRQTFPLCVLSRSFVAIQSGVSGAGQGSAPPPPKVWRGKKDFGYFENSTPFFEFFLECHPADPKIEVSAVENKV